MVSGFKAAFNIRENRLLFFLTSVWPLNANTAYPSVQNILFHQKIVQLTVNIKSLLKKKLPANEVFFLSFNLSKKKPVFFLYSNLFFLYLLLHCFTFTMLRKRKAAEIMAIIKKVILFYLTLREKKYLFKLVVIFV